MANHHIAIPAVLKVGKGVLPTIGSCLKDSGSGNVVIYFGNGLIDLSGCTVMDSMREAGVSVLEIVKRRCGTAVCSGVKRMEVFYELFGDKAGDNRKRNRGAGFSVCFGLQASLQRVL